ncbi:MAG: thermonuclease family protein [Dehalococcoidia bacterium]|nr:thermonuclease family protein [Dehalococcoidia bacterium]
MTPRLLLYVLIAFLFAQAASWSPLSADLDAPVGCASVFAATTRGGSAAPVRGEGGCNPFRSYGSDEVRVIRVIDGDTIEVSGGRRVRYIGVDAPEVSGVPQHYGPEATDSNNSLVAGRMVTLEKDVSDVDRFGRLLRFVYADGILVNAELVREGYARARVYPPDTAYAECFAVLEQEAMEAKRGVWGR